MLNIGELMYALGHADESLEWTERGVDSARKAMDQQPHEESRQRCAECAGNGCNSLGILYEVANLCGWTNESNEVSLNRRWNHLKRQLILGLSQRTDTM